MALLLGLDVGTTSCKAGLFAGDGELLALASSSYPVERDAPGWVEQDPELYWQAARRVIREVLVATGIPSSRIAALGACGQTPTIVLLGPDGRPVRPAILWQDTRAHAEAAALARDPGADRLAEWLGLRWPLDASFPAARLLWLRRHEPETVRRAHVLLQPKDYVNFRLTGVLASDPWSSKGLVHLRTREAPDALLELIGAARTLVPACVWAHEVTGRIHAAAAAETGLAEGLPVAAGWSDGMASMLGAGAFAAAGLACDVSGTSEVVGITAAADQVPADPAPLLAAPLLDTDLAAVYGPTQTSGAALGWVLRLCWSGGNPPAGSPDDVLPRALAAAAEIAPGSDGALFLPYLEGERAPIWDPQVRAVFAGLTSRHGAAHATRAVLEGVALSVRHILDHAARLTGTTPTVVRVAGGGARIGLWNQIKADVLGCPVAASPTVETGVLGAAMLAGLAAGLFPSVADASQAMVRLGPEVQPEPAHAALYSRAYQVYRDLYPRLRGL